jgi:hypothetical protein
MSLEDDLVANSPQKCRAKKASKKSPKKKLKIGPTELLAFSKANRQKGKAIIVTKANKEIIVGKVQLKQKIRYLYHFKMPAKLIKALNSKKKLEDSIFSILY